MYYATKGSQYTNLRWFSISSDPDWQNKGIKGFNNSIPSEISKR